jgi:hypothetical protein
MVHWAAEGDWLTFVDTAVGRRFGMLDAGDADGEPYAYGESVVTLTGAYARRTPLSL